jgi:hypothetical protein
MEELVFCCTNCLSVSRSGISIDPLFARRCSDRAVCCRCEKCDAANVLALRDTMLCAAVTEDGRFAATAPPRELF